MNSGNSVLQHLAFNCEPPSLAAFLVETLRGSVENTVVGVACIAVRFGTIKTQIKHVVSSALTP